MTKEALAVQAALLRRRKTSPQARKASVQNLLRASEFSAGSMINYNHHNSSLLPGTVPIAEVIRGDAATLAMLRSIYMQDYLCLPPYYREIGAKELDS